MEEQESRLGEPLPPLAVCIAAAIFISSSVLALVGMVVDILFRDTVMLNFGVVVWFVGTGLLARKGNALRWARFLFGCGWVFLPLGIIALIVRVVRGSAQLSEPLVFPQLLMFVLLLCIAVFGAWLLKRDGVADWFALDEAEGIEVPKLIVLPVAVSSLVVGVGMALSSWVNEQMLEAIYDYDLSVMLVDADSGMELKTFSSSSSETVSSSRKRGFRRESSSGTLRGKDGGAGRRFTGVADTPIVFKVSSDGYEAKEIVVSKERRGGEIEVPLRRLPVDE